jgi:hypothetical protein
MDKAMKSFLILCIIGIFSVELAEAQLINYQRRNKTLPAKPAAPQATPAAKTYGMPEQAATPAATKKMADPAVQTKLERQYDLNNDGILQSTEVTSFLKEVIKGVEKKGSYPVNSELIKKYDVNFDGNINKSEVSQIVREVNK